MPVPNCHVILSRHEERSQQIATIVDKLGAASAKVCTSSGPECNRNENLCPTGSGSACGSHHIPKAKSLFTHSLRAKR